MNANELKDKKYLGDGVYAGNDGWQIWVWVDDSRPIALEPMVMMSLKSYEKALQEKQNETNE